MPPASHTHTPTPGPASALARLLALLLALTAPLAHPAPALAQPTPVSTEFVYQGLLANASGPITTPFRATFRLFDAPTGGNEVGPPVIFFNVVPDANGRFNVTLDFGTESATSAVRWLEVTVGQSAQFSVLSPRQAVTPATSAAFAARAGSVPAVSGATAEVLDQTSGVGNGTAGSGASGIFWQSFTVGADGLLTRIDLRSFGSSGPGTLRLFRSTGPITTPIAESTITFSPGGDSLNTKVQSFPIPALRVSAGDVLTWQVLGNIANVQVSNGYPGGVPNPQVLGPGGDFFFRTFLVPLQPVSLNGSPVIVPERLHVRAAAASETEPAVALTSQGRIGIKTGTPQAALDIAGAPGTDGIRFPDGTVQTTAFRGLRLAFTSSAVVVIQPGSGTATIPMPGVQPGDSVFVTPRLNLPSNLTIAAVSVNLPGQVTLQLRNPSILPVTVPIGGLAVDLLAIR